MYMHDQLSSKIIPIMVFSIKHFPDVSLGETLGVTKDTSLFQKIFGIKKRLVISNQMHSAC